MREIKFRGKRKDNGQWVHGDLIHGVGSKSGRMYILPVTPIYPKGCNELDGWDVIPTTVGQSTGLTDKGGKEIYEGDILLSKGQNRKYIQVVEFHNTSKTCGRGWVGVNHIEIERRNGEDVMTTISDRFSYFSFPCSCEIIGNIHDNPELLEQTK